MANTVAKQTIHDSARNLVVKINIIGDGSGDEAASLLIDVSTYAGAPAKVSIDKVNSNLEGFTARLLWDASTDVEALLLGQLPFAANYKHFGGLVNNAGSGVTGDIRLTTSGLGTGDQGTIILEMRKIYS